MVDFCWSQRTLNPVLVLPFSEGLPSPEKAAEISAWVRKHSDRYKAEYVSFFHGTDPRLPIEDEGLKPTTLARRRSIQSQSGYVYLANTPGRAEIFGSMGNGGRCAVYEVLVPVRKLCADLDQLNNQRATGRYPGLGNSIGESVIYGGGVRIKGAIEPWQVRLLSGYGIHAGANAAQPTKKPRP